jgi:hypothetical protein
MGNRKLAKTRPDEITKADSKKTRASETATDPLPQAARISRDFWESPTLDELALAQNVKPIADVRALFGTWPGEEDDGFEAAIDELRHHIR